MAAPAGTGFIVLAPPAASKVDVLDAAGGIVGSAPLVGGVGVLPPRTAGTLRALDGAGRIVGTGVTPIEPQRPALQTDTPMQATVNAWD